MIDFNSLTEKRPKDVNVQHVMGTKVYLFLALFILTLSPSVLVMYSNVSVHHNHFKFIFQLIIIEGELLSCSLSQCIYFGETWSHRQG
jgi:hypothetical protein